MPLSIAALQKGLELEKTLVGLRKENDDLYEGLPDEHKSIGDFLQEVFDGEGPVAALKSESLRELLSPALADESVEGLEEVLEAIAKPFSDTKRLYPKGSLSRFFDGEGAEEAVTTLLKSLESAGASDEYFNHLRLLSIAVASLVVYLSDNYLGHPLAGKEKRQKKDEKENDEATTIPLLDGVTKDYFSSSEAVPRHELSNLSLDGEFYYAPVRRIKYFLLGQNILMDFFDNVSLCPTAYWWRFRVAVLHQQLLSGPSPSMKDKAMKAFEQVAYLCGGHALQTPTTLRSVPVEALNESLLRASAGEETTSVRAPHLEGEEDREFEPPLFNEGRHSIWIGRAYLEAAMFLSDEYGLRDFFLARRYLRTAMKNTGVRIRLTGALGKRTQFQTFNTAQLVVDAETLPQFKPKMVSSTLVKAPETLEADYKDVLQAPSVKDQHAENPFFTTLHPVDLALVLAHCFDVQGHNPHDRLTYEEMAPYMERALKDGEDDDDEAERKIKEHSRSKREERKRDWALFSSALLIKTRLEFPRSRTKDRAVLQLQTLVDQFFDEEPPPLQRLPSLFLARTPPRWRLRQELAGRQLSYGAAASALELFEELEMWEDVVTCYRVLDKPKKAQETVERLLEGDLKDSPTIWCLLGDITKVDAHYEKAWDLSKNRSARAQRSLAFSAVRRNDFEAALKHFRLALSLNSLYPHSWFVRGVCAMSLQLWDEALICFSRVIQQTPDDGETWNNIAAVYVRMHQNEQAFVAFQEALKYKRSDRRIWINFITLSVETRHFQHAIFGMEKLLELRRPDGHDASKAELIDLDALTAVTRAIITGVPDAEEESNARMRSRLAALFTKIAGFVSNSVRVWDLRCDLHIAENDAKEELDCRKRQLRSSMVAGWEKDVGKLRIVAMSAEKLAEAFFKADNWTEQNKRSCLLQLESLAEKASLVLGETEEAGKLRQLLSVAKSRAEA